MENFSTAKKNRDIEQFECLYNYDGHGKNTAR